MSDVDTIFQLDPSVKRSLGSYLEVVLTYPGLHALWTFRVAHRLYRWGVPVIPRALSQTARFFTGVDIHPAATIRGSLFIDHGAGVVIGSTADIGDGVLIYSGVVLGSRQGGIDRGYHAKRHPTIRDNVMIGAGAKILGPVTVGSEARIGANSVVLADVPAGRTAVGAPARLV